MSNPKYTPGPWIIEDQLDGPLSLMGPNGEVLMRIRGGMKPVSHDARLIAAAPDMLEALEHLIKLANIDDRLDSYYRENNAELGEIHALIRKARGE